MRFIHTSDWHLGKVLHQRSLLEDQQHALAQLYAILKDTQPDALLIAGDIYDRSVPPGDAVCVLDDFLARVSLDLALPVVMIAGNHDSAERIGFGARLMADRRVCIAGPMTAELPTLTLTDAHGPVVFHPLPYADPATVQLAQPYEDPRTHQRAMQALVAQAHARTPAGTRSVCVAHAFVQGGTESESERPLSVGGSGQVEPSVFDGFHYVALGHLHRPQDAGRPELRYSGSLLKYSFSEAEHQKGVSLVELNATGAATVQHLPITPKRDLMRVEGTLEELLSQPDPAAKQAYLQVLLTDKGALLDPMAKLRAVYPHVLDLRRSAFLDVADPSLPTRDAVRGSKVQLFADFYSEVGGGTLSDEQRAVLAEVFTSVQAEEDAP
ncbi:MAG: exonuclease SbcCD subunit D [Sandaracinaceae bacterium]|nr:exonuclease SbcCD subunit D [Sandaracinaceae bacterium]